MATPSPTPKRPGRQRRRLPLAARQPAAVSTRCWSTFPDPSNFSIGKLYTVSFYRELSRALAPGAVASIQSTSPLVAPRAYWTVATTLEAAGLKGTGYHVYVPSFGEWGFVLATHGDLAATALPCPRASTFLTPVADRLAFFFPPDMARRTRPR